MFEMIAGTANAYNLDLNTQYKYNLDLANLNEVNDQEYKDIYKNGITLVTIGLCNGLLSLGNALDFHKTLASIWYSYNVMTLAGFGAQEGMPTGFGMIYIPLAVSLFQHTIITMTYESD